MKTLNLLALAASTALASPALAALAPTNTLFTAVGAMTVSQLGSTNMLTCKVEMKGKTNGLGKARFTVVVFQGGPGCSAVVATLPWHATGVLPVGPTSGAMKMTASFFGPCVGAAVVVPMTISAGGAWTLSGTFPTGCAIHGSLQTAPHIT